jgi:hypothetical protein
MSLRINLTNPEQTMSTSKKESGKITGQTTGQITKKSGKGNSHGVVSEVSAYLTVKPGHEEEARAAALRFGEMLKKSNWKDIQKTGLRALRWLADLDT